MNPKIDFHPLGYVKDDKLKYAIIIAKYKDRWVFVRQRGKTGWELPAGKREPYENIDKTAKREIAEETGALKFEIEPILIYSVETEKDLGFGQLFYCKIESLSHKLEYEIEEIGLFDEVPSLLSYPDIQPKLFEKAKEAIREKSKIRVFLGIDLKSSLKRQIEGYQEELKRYSSKGKWKSPDNFHITLKYLGDIDMETIEKIDQAMKDVKTDSFSLNISNIAAFKRKEKLRVVYLSIEKDLRELDILYNKIEKAMKKIGFVPESRAYTPHITLVQDVNFIDSLENIEIKVHRPEFETITVESVTLFESKREHGKRKYEPLREYSLM